MQSKDKIRVQHILDEAGEISKYTEDKSFEEFVKDGKTVRAVIRSIEVIGEAASRMSTEFHEAHPEIPWQKIIAMRNRLIHVYFDIDYDIIWQTIKENLPDLTEKLQKIKNDHD